MHVWDKIEKLAETLESKFISTGIEYSRNSEDGWSNYLYKSKLYRRAHIEIVDFRKTHKVYILHSTVFPHFNDSSPIWGFDAVCGANKITGAFHDFSAAGDPNHSMIDWFAEKSKQYQWTKSRNLPSWAKAIFSDHMLAAGNVREGLELDNLCSFAEESLDYYLANIGKLEDWPADYHMAQNRYCHYQKQNPHLINSMEAMGIPRYKIESFIDEVLFPESNLQYFF